MWLQSQLFWDFEKLIQLEIFLKFKYDLKNVENYKKKIKKKRLKKNWKKNSKNPKIVIFRRL